MSVPLDEHHFKQLGPERFESLVTDLLTALGCTTSGNVMLAGQQLDIVATVPVEDPTGLLTSYRLAVECKHYAQSGRSVSVQDVMERCYILSSIECDALLIVSSTRFTLSAIEAASSFNKQQNSMKRVYLWTCDDLIRRLRLNPEVTARFLALDEQIDIVDFVYQGNPALLRSGYSRIKQAKESGSNDEKKKALEEFVADLFSCIKGWTCTQRNRRTSTNEVDCLFRNANTTHPLLSEFGVAIPAECRCVVDPCSSRDVQNFETVVRECGCTTGLFVTTSYFTGSKEADHRLGDAELAVKNAFREGRQLICLDGNDIKQIVEGRDLVEILWEKVEDIRML